MQKLVLVLCALFFTLPTFAQRERSMLKIRDMEGRNITVEINGRRFERVGKMLTFRDLPPRNHSIKVYVVNRTRNNNRRARLIYQGRLRTRPGKIYYVTVDDYEKLDIITDCCLGDNGPWNEPNTWYRSRYYDQQNWEGDIQFNPQRDTYYNYDKDEERRRKYERRYKKDDWDHYQSGMSSARFNNLLQSMENASFESNRLSLVKQALSNNHVSTNQLVKIMKAMSFESSRMNVAKMAYEKVVDKENTFQINNGFSFSSSRDEYQRFLENRRR
jgi:hypothetical protein